MHAITDPRLNYMTTKLTFAATDTTEPHVLDPLLRAAAVKAARDFCVIMNVGHRVCAVVCLVFCAFWRAICFFSRLVCVLSLTHFLAFVSVSRVNTDGVLTPVTSTTNCVELPHCPSSRMCMSSAEQTHPYIRRADKCAVCRAQSDPCPLDLHRVSPSRLLNLLCRVFFFCFFFGCR